MECCGIFLLFSKIILSKYKHVAMRNKKPAFGITVIYGL